MIATVSFAQSSLLATLSHNGTISTFYGTTALKEALAKADHGDAITLSAGQFQAGNIEKAITLRGAGMSVNTDSINAHESTILSGDFSIMIKDTVPERLVMEGIYHTGSIANTAQLNNAMFLKCRFYSFSSQGSSNFILKNCTFIHCRFANHFWLGSNSNAYMINSVVFCPSNSSTNASNFQFDNCVICWPSGYFPNSVINSYYKNCVIIFASNAGMSNYSIPSSNVAYKCVGINTGGATDLFGLLLSKNTTNVFLGTSTTSLLKYGYGYSDVNTYELTDEAKTKYLGTDNKEVGIHGGNLPYEEDPTTPQITKCNVAAKSTADGKLSVDIEVKAAEY